MKPCERGAACVPVRAVARIGRQRVITVDMQMLELSTGVPTNGPSRGLDGTVRPNDLSDGLDQSL